MSKSEMKKVATKILRRNGYTSAGRPQKDVNPAQFSFERRLIIVPVGTAR